MSPRSSHRTIPAAVASVISVAAANADIIPISRFSEYRAIPDIGPPTVASTTAFGLWQYGNGTAHTSNTLSNGASLTSSLQGTSGMPGSNVNYSSTFRFTFSVLEAHQFSFSGTRGATPGNGSGSASLVGPGVNHSFSSGAFVFSVTGFLQPGTYTVRGDCSAGGVGFGQSNFDLSVQIPAPATALLAPFLLAMRRQRRRKCGSV